ncbi:MAG: helix-hairpin-helix domain-containing protein, partial [Bacteroidetes bacterium]
MSRLTLICALLLGLPRAGLLAQIDSLRPVLPDASGVEQAIEDVILGNEAGEDVDYTFITDQLADLRAEPLDLNRASREALRQLPGMTDLQIQRLRLHIETFGPLLSIYELQAVAGFGPELIRQIAPFVAVYSGRETDVRPEDAIPAGPDWEEVRQGMTYEWIQRVTWIGETQRGYTAPDTSFRDLTDAEGNLLGVDTVLSTRYAGSPFRSYTRFRARYRQHVSLVLVGEKDPGEVMAWDP